MNARISRGGRPPARRSWSLIEELVDLKLPNVHLCVASRPEMDIRMVLETVDFSQDISS
jgi:hypothetical protein